MSEFHVEILCDHPSHGDRPRIIDSFLYAAHRDTGVPQWFWEITRKLGGGKRDRLTGLGEWMEKDPSHRTVLEDGDGRRLRLRCKGHADVGMSWEEFVSRYLEPCRANGMSSVPVRVVVSAQTNPTRRRGRAPSASGGGC